MVGGIEDEDLEKGKGNETEGTDLGENLLQVTGGVVILANQRGATSKECVGTEMTTPSASPCLQAEPLRKQRDQRNWTARRMRRKDTREALIAKLRVLREGFTSQAGLIDDNVDRFGETGIGGTKDTWRLSYRVGSPPCKGKGLWVQSAGPEGAASSGNRSHSLSQRG